MTFSKFTTAGVERCGAAAERGRDLCGVSDVSISQGPRLPERGGALVVKISSKDQ